MATRPNIVFVLADDLSTNLVRYMPAVRALARRGATFTNYYVTDSLCCPSRTSIFTGLLPHDSGVFTNSGRNGGFRSFDRHGDTKTRSLGVPRDAVDAVGVPHTRAPESRYSPAPDRRYGRVIAPMKGGTPSRCLAVAPACVYRSAFPLPTITRVLRRLVVASAVNTRYASCADPR